MGADPSCRGDGVGVESTAMPFAEILISSASFLASAKRSPGL